MTDDDCETRRRFLLLATAGAAGGLAGCGGGGGDGDGGGGNGDGETERPSPTETDGNGGGTGTPEPVPSEYETATSLGGTRRNPNGLSTQAAVEYQSSPNDGNRCSECQFYIPDMNGDGLGACAIVEGLIDPEGWCVSFAPYEDGTDGGTDGG